MATFDYASIKEIATDLIVEFGTTATLRKSGGPSDTDKPWRPDDTKTTSTIKILDLDQLQSFRGEAQGSNASSADGSAIQRSRKLLIAGDSAVTPEAGDEVQINGIWEQLLDVSPLNPGGTLLLWEAVVKT